MSVYPAAVKQFFRNTLTVANGKVTLIDHPCVVKHISTCPTSSDTLTSFTTVDSVILVVYDGTNVIMKIAGSANANYLCSNVSILIPADGLKINDYLAVECESFGTSGGSNTEKKQANISVMYQ